MSELCQAQHFAVAAARGELVEGEGESSRDAAAAGRDRPRRLLLCLDGVPLDLVRELKGRGMFERFNEPARLLSPFPTMTNVALAQMFRATPPPGYESFYFDRDERRLSGGVRKYLGRRTPDKVPSSYMDELDYQEPLPFEFLVYVAPEAVWRAVCASHAESGAKPLSSRWPSSARARSAGASCSGSPPACS